MYLQYPKMVYVALINYGLRWCVNVQCTSFQRARHSDMKASSFRDFSGVQGQRKMPQDKYIKTPEQKLYVSTLSPHTRDLAI